MRDGSSTQTSLGMVMGEHTGGMACQVRHDHSVASVVIVCQIPHQSVERLQGGKRSPSY
jgi:hypothetical protein